MKVSLQLAVIACIVAASYASTAAAAPCDFAELPFQLGDVVEPAFQCQTASGYSFVQPSALPTAAELKAICDKCKALLTAVTNAKDDLPKCALSMDDGSTVTIDKLLTGVAAQCTSAGKSVSGGGGSTSPASTSSDTKSAAVTIPTNPPPVDQPTTKPPPSTRTKEKGATANVSNKTMSPSSSGSRVPEEAETHDASAEGSLDHDVAPTPTTTVPSVAKATARPVAAKQTSSSAVGRMGVTAVSAAAIVFAWALV